MAHVSIRETLLVLAVLLISGLVTVVVLARDGGPETRWRFEFGSPVGAGPALHSGVVYAGSEAGGVAALHATTGEALWEASVDATPRGLIRTDGTRIYFRTDEGDVFALVAATGHLAWRVSVEGGANTPLLSGDDVIVASRLGEVFALDAATGEERWLTNAGRTLRADPALVGPQDEVVAVGDIGGRLHTFAADSGEPLGEELLGDEFAGPPLATGSGLIAALRPAIVAVRDDDTKTWRAETGEPNRLPMVEQAGVLYVDASPDLLAIDIATGEMLWRYTSPALVVTFGIGETLAVAGMHTGEVHGIDLATGERLWRYRTNEAVRGAPVIDDAAGLAYFGGRDGVLYAIEIGAAGE